MEISRAASQGQMPIKCRCITQPSRRVIMSGSSIFFFLFERGDLDKCCVSSYVSVGVQDAQAGVQSVLNALWFQTQSNLLQNLAPRQAASRGGITGCTSQQPAPLPARLQASLNNQRDILQQLSLELWPPFGMHLRLP
jgi:hypothetical protein